MKYEHQCGSPFNNRYTWQSRKDKGSAPKACPRCKKYFEPGELKEASK